MRGYELELPRGFRSFDWIELNAAEPLGENLYVISDTRTGGGRAITFQSLGRVESETERVRVGACPQWKGYRGKVFLNVVANGPPLDVRLIR